MIWEGEEMKKKRLLIELISKSMSSNRELLNSNSISHNNKTTMITKKRRTLIIINTSWTIITLWTNHSWKTKNQLRRLHSFQTMKRSRSKLILMLLLLKLNKITNKTIQMDINNHLLCNQMHHLILKYWKRTLLSLEEVTLMMIIKHQITIQTMMLNPHKTHSII